MYREGLMLLDARGVLLFQLPIVHFILVVCRGTLCYFVSFCILISWDLNELCMKKNTHQLVYQFKVFLHSRLFHFEISSDLSYDEL